MNSPAKAGLAEWIERIRDQEMPIFNHTVQKIVSVTEDDSAPAAALARVVLEDASMTARVLKLANSGYYNPRQQAISTVSRAVIVLGFNTVQNMSLSIALVDSFLHGPNRERLTHELARSIHAAVQARAVALERGDRSAEEVFIATLLYRLGDLAFWCFSGSIGEELDALMQQPGYTPERAQDEVLGFRLHQLTAGLAQEWRLNELLRFSLNHQDSRDPRARTVLLSHAVAESAERHGWHAPPTQEKVNDVASLMGVKPKAAADLLHRSAREAARIAGLYGASVAAKAIPVPSKYAEQLESEQTAAEQIKRFPEPDGMLQLKILRELSLLLETKADFNLIMELVLEGIYRGVGTDRTLFALLTPDRRGVKAKYALGEGNRQFTARFHFLRHPQQRNVFFESMERKSCVWYDREKRPDLAPFVSSAVTAAVGLAPFFCCPILVGSKCIGLFYADRAVSDRPLDEESYEAFKHFVKQANMGLSLAAGGRR